MQARFHCSRLYHSSPSPTDLISYPTFSTRDIAAPLAFFMSLSPQRPPPYGFWTPSSLCLECSHPALCLAGFFSFNPLLREASLNGCTKEVTQNLSFNFHLWFSSYQLLLFYYLFIILLSLSLACTNLVFLAHCSAPHACHSAWHIADTQYLTGKERVTVDEMSGAAGAAALLICEWPQTCGVLQASEEGISVGLSVPSLGAQDLSSQLKERITGLVLKNPICHVPAGFWDSKENHRAFPF